MSVTFSIGCHDHRQKLWIGQTSCGNPSFYSGDEIVMKDLKEFFFKHTGCRLGFNSDFSEWLDECEEFPKEKPKCRLTSDGLHRMECRDCGAR